MFYTDEEKIKYIEQYVDDLDNIPPSERERFKEIVEEGCRKEWPVALHAKGYGCYGGNELWECDWVVARDCMLKLIELTENPFCYNTLGYIYYYGRCNGGVPEYEKAFQYFAVGAAHGIYESRYKMSDMFLGGKGVPRNKAAAFNMVQDLYSENLDILQDGIYEGKFADIALRMGGFYERGDAVEQDFEEAYAFYCEAEFAINKRMESCDMYGDSKVKRSITEALARVKPQLPEDFFRKYITMDNPVLLGMLLNRSAGLDVTIDTTRKGYVITAKGFPGEKANGRLLVNMSALNYCEVTDTVKLYLDSNARIVKPLDFPAKVFITGISYDESNVCRLKYRDMVMMEFTCENFYFYNG